MNRYIIRELNEDGDIVTVYRTIRNFERNGTALRGAVTHLVETKYNDKMYAIEDLQDCRKMGYDNDVVILEVW